MSIVKKIVCLANSRKYSGRCIARKEVLANGYGGWIRPVSERPKGELSEDECRCKDGGEPRLLEIINIPVVKAIIHLHQTENHVIDPVSGWTKAGNVPWEDLKRLVDKPASLWTNGDSSFYGQNDRVKLDVASKLPNSLIVIEPENLSVQVQIEGAEFGNPEKHVRAKFRFRGTNYSLAVTDVIAERVFQAKEDGVYPLENTYLCISLGEEYKGWCYKLVAAIISKQPL